MKGEVQAAMAERRTLEEGDSDEEQHGLTEPAVLPELDTQCGLGPCRPRSLQRLSNIGVFTGVYGIAGFVTSSLSAYLMSQVTSLERQFGLSSSQSGFLIGCNDIGYLVSAVIASHFATRLHVPRTLAMATLFFGLSAFLSASPHFLFGYHRDDASLDLSKGGNSSSEIPLCGLDWTSPCANATNPGVASSKLSTAKNFGQAAFGIIAVSMMIQGVAKSFRFPFLTAYIDDNVVKTRTGFYMGIISSLGVFGPALAFGVGGVFSRLYVTLEDRHFSPRDPRWVGAWWLGFLVFGAMAVLCALPLSLFPRQLTNGRPSKRKLASQSGKRSKVWAELREFLGCLRRLGGNAAFLLITASSTVKIFSVAAALSFMPKFLETQFQQPAWRANLLLAGINVIAAALGTFIGGVLTSRFKMAERGCLKVITGLEVCVLVMSVLGFLLGCPQPRIVGTSLPGHNPVWDGAWPDEVTCGGAPCSCSSAEFFPVCSQAGHSYFSPCLLGCSSASPQNISGCACVTEGWVKAGVCEQDCGNLAPYGAFVFALSLVSCLTIMPHYVATIRCVQDRDKSMAAGISAFLQSLFGWFLGPMVFGAVIDSTCLLWEDKCGTRGACAIHDNADFRFKLHGMVAGPRFLSMLFAAACLCLYVRRGRQSGAKKNELVVFVDGSGHEDRMIRCDVP